MFLLWRIYADRASIAERFDPTLNVQALLPSLSEDVKARRKIRMSSTHWHLIVSVAAAGRVEYFVSYKASRQVRVQLKVFYCVTVKDTYFISVHCSRATPTSLGTSTAHSARGRLLTSNAFSQLCKCAPHIIGSSDWVHFRVSTYSDPVLAKRYESFSRSSYQQIMRKRAPQRAVRAAMAAEAVLVKLGGNRNVWDLLLLARRRYENRHHQESKRKAELEVRFPFC